MLAKPRNLQSRIDEHLDTSKLSEPAMQTPLLTSATFFHMEIYGLYSILEALLIVKLCPNLNKQVKALALSLFPTGIT